MTCPYCLNVGRLPVPPGAIPTDARYFDCPVCQENRIAIDENSELQCVEEEPDFDDIDLEGEDDFIDDDEDLDDDDFDEDDYSDYD